MVYQNKMGDGPVGYPGGSRGSIEVMDRADVFTEFDKVRVVNDRERGSAYSWFDRLFMGWEDGRAFSYSDWEARDLADMMKADYKARQVEAVLTYPTMRCERTIKPAKGDRGEAEWLTNFWQTDALNGGCETDLDTIVEQMTSAVIYKKAYWNLVWTRGRGDFEGKAVYKRVAWRPQTTTRSLHHPASGRITGWRQEPYALGPGITRGLYPIYVEGLDSFVHVHGNRRDPVNGISDLEVPYWAYKTKLKILFLLAQFLERVSLPLTTVKAQDPEVAVKIAAQIAASNASGVVPIGTEGNPNNVSIDVTDLSGKGAEQYMSMISYLDQCATNSIMAGFLDLTSAAANGRGSNALSSDASDFFLMSLESKHREYETSLRRGLFAPLVRMNFGRSSKVPLLKFSPLNAEDKTSAVSMLQDLMRSRDPSLVPDEFLQQLVQSVADYLGMNGEKLAKAFEGAAEKARQQAAQAMQLQSQMTQTGRGTQLLAKNASNVAAVTGAVGAATRAVQAGKAGKDPVKAARGTRSAA